MSAPVATRDSADRETVSAPADPETIRREHAEWTALCRGSLGVLAALAMAIEKGRGQ